MRTLLISAVSAATLLLAACSQGGKVPDSVDRMARSEVEAIVKNYLISNPEVLSEAITALGKHEQQKVFASLLTQSNDPSLGPKDAPITIVEFFDYNCGYCKAATDWVFNQVDDRQGDVRVVFKEFPILAESSLDAAKAALAADRQGKYREMHNALMKTRDLTPEGLEKTARSVGLDVAKWKTDMASDGVLIQIDQVRMQGEQAGVQGTPGFFINGQFLNGFHEETLRRAIDNARKEARAAKSSG